MELNFEDAVKRAFTLWLRDSKTWKYMFFVYAVALVFIILAGILLFALFGPIVAQVIENPSLLQNPDSLVGLVPDIISGVLVFLALFLPLALAESLVVLYIYSLVQVRALQLNGLSTEPFSFGKMFRLIGLWIYTTLASFFSFYNKTLMILSIVYILIFLILGLLSIFSPIAILLLLLWLFLGIPYLCIVIYNGFRLSLAPMVFLHKNVSITEAAGKSWDMTRGNLIMIFVISLVVGIIIGVASMVLDLFAQGIGGIFDSIFGTVFLAIVFSWGISFLTGPVLQIAELHIMPAIYAQLLDSSPQIVPQKPQSNVSQQKGRWSSKA